AVDAATGAFTAQVPLLEGLNNVTAVAVDLAGNAGTATIAVFLDTTRPTVVVENPPPRGEGGQCDPDLSDLKTESPRVTVTGFLNDIGSAQVGGAPGAVVVRSFTCTGQPIVADTPASLEGKAFVLLDFPLRRGVNQIEVVGRDGVGNVSRPVRRTVTFLDVAGQRIRRVSGDGQTGVVNTLLLEPLVVSLTDADGRAVPNRTVKFEVVRNSGRLSESIGAGNRVRELFVRSDAQGRAAAYLTLGDRVGAGYNRVSATAAGFEGEALFCATAIAGLPSRILATEGASQTGIPGQALPRPLVALAVDDEGNPIPELPITFEVGSGGGSLSPGGGGAGGASTLVVPTSAEGLAACVFTLGEQEGLNAHSATARFEGLVGIAAVYTATAKMPRNVQETAVAGVVIDNTDVPLEGVTARLLDTGGLEARTDAQGLFRIPGAPVGTMRLRIDGSTSTRPGTWPTLEFQITTIAGQDNGTGGPIRLPPVDRDHSFVVGGDETVVVTMEGVPGMSLTVSPRSVTFPNGDTVGRLSLSQVKLDKVPMPPPNGSIFMPPAWTIQPPGVFFDPPARISIPNDGLPPGRIIDIFQFDHDLEMFTNAGTGTVVPDASVIISDPGFGITKSGWGGCGQPPPPPTCAASCDDGNPCTDDKCENGSCVHTPKNTPQTVANGCEGCNNGMRLPPKTEAECCADNTVTGSPVTTASTAGWVVCCNGQKTVCVKPLPPASYPLSTVLDACNKKHEEQHFGDIDCPTGADECKTSRPNFKNTRPQADGECDAYKVTIACLRRHDCMGDATCQMNIDFYIMSYKDIANGFKAGCVP
ncbi:MAG: carboxypeptidase regulatory-like domain-containing protein, partial [Planctomycetes bacterium]|nr:carboxypeptidase regulatory-like domain-containing protein [Planctomycetota bacterium]